MKVSVSIDEQRVISLLSSLLFSTLLYSSLLFPLYIASNFIISLKIERSYHMVIACLSP